MMNEVILHVRFKDGTKATFRVNEYDLPYEEYVAAVQDLTEQEVQVILCSVKWGAFD